MHAGLQGRIVLRDGPTGTSGDTPTHSRATARGARLREPPRDSPSMAFRLLFIGPQSAAVAVERSVETMNAGEGEFDEPALLIYRALQGKPGKVTIGGRLYSFSCIPAFRLMDDLTGRVHHCPDSTALMRRIRALSQESRAGRAAARRNPDVGALRGKPSSVNQLSSWSSPEAPPGEGPKGPSHLSHRAGTGPGDGKRCRAHGGVRPVFAFLRRPVDPADAKEPPMNHTRKLGPLAVALAATALLMATPAAAAGAGADARQEESATVDINTATVEELMSVPGIGQSIAQRIAEFREKNGPFKTVDDLLKVQGIGEKSLARIRAKLSVGKAKK